MNWVAIELIYRLEEECFIQLNDLKVIGIYLVQEIVVKFTH
jgi:hypothetical protein